MSTKEELESKSNLEDEDFEEEQEEDDELAEYRILPDTDDEEVGTASKSAKSNKSYISSWLLVKTPIGLTRQQLLVAMFIALVCCGIAWYMVLQDRFDPFPALRRERAKSLEALRRKQPIPEGELEALSQRYKTHWITTEEGTVGGKTKEGGAAGGAGGGGGGGGTKTQLNPNMAQPQQPHHAERVQRPSHEARQAASVRQNNPRIGNKF